MDKLKEDKQISRAVARFFAHGEHHSAESTSLVGGSGGILPQKYSEILFSALMSYVSEKSTVNMKMAKNCKLP